MERTERFRKVAMQFADPYADNCKKLYFIGKNPTCSILFVNFIDAGVSSQGFGYVGRNLFGGGWQGALSYWFTKLLGCRLGVCDSMVNARQAKVTESFRWTYNSPFIVPCASNGCAFDFGSLGRSVRQACLTGLGRAKGGGELVDSVPSGMQLHPLGFNAFNFGCCFVPLN